MHYLNSVETVIEVGGKPCDFLYLHLSQSMTDHHRFEIGVNYNHRRSSTWVETPQKIFEQLAKRVYIRMKHRESGEETEFFGVITDIDLVGREGDRGTVVLKGGSPTLLLDRDPAMGAFTSYSLNQLVGWILDHSGVKMTVQSQPLFTGQIPYVGRYKESSYAFLARVFASFGEWFYYDGQKLIVGNPHIEKNKDLFYDMEMQNVKMSTSVRNLNVHLYDYNPSENFYTETSPLSSIEGDHYFLRTARAQSDPLYPTAAKLPALRKEIRQGDIIDVVGQYHSRNYSRMLIFEGKTTTCGLRLGEFATTIIPKSFQDVTEYDLGRYRVIEIHHHIERDGSYYNTFKGVMGLTPALPVDNIVWPVAFPEPATVVDNEDPLKQGRVKVRFLWQNDRDPWDITNWMRVQTPDAGQSGAVAANRGLWFIPEKGDQVMIGFEQGDPNRPYVTGSLYHSGNTKGVARDNTLHSIVTKSGHTLEFNDDEKGGWGITLKDREGNLLRMDSHGKNIEIMSPETIRIQAKNIDLTAKENIRMSADSDLIESAGKNKTESVGETLVTSAKNQTTTVEENQHTQVKQKMSMDVMMDAVVTVDGNVSVNGTGVSLNATGADVFVTSPGKITLKSGDIVDIAQ